MVMKSGKTPAKDGEVPLIGSPMLSAGGHCKDVRTPDQPSTPGGGISGSSSKKKPLGSSPALSLHHDFKAKKKSPTIKVKSFRDPEMLTIHLNIYDLVWDKEKGKNNAGLADLGLGFYHTGLELWGKELSFGHSKRFKSGVFAVKPKKADELMPHTVFRQSIEMDTIYISRYSVDKILNRLSAKYTSDAYNVVRNNCNHFTEELCQALCGKDIPEWVNRPAKMGCSTLDVLNAPFEAFNSVIRVFTPSKASPPPAHALCPRLKTRVVAEQPLTAPLCLILQKANASGVTSTASIEASKTPGRGTPMTPGRRRAPMQEGPTAEQLEMVGEIPDDAEQVGRVSRNHSVPLLASPSSRPNDAEAVSV